MYYYYYFPLGHPAITAPVQPLNGVAASMGNKINDIVIITEKNPRNNNVMHNIENQSNWTSNIITSSEVKHAIFKPGLLNRMR